MATIAVALIGAVEVLLLAIINRRQTVMAHNLNSHLTHLEETQATDVELDDRRPRQKRTK